MGIQFDYSILFDKALGRIKSVRDPHAAKPDTVDLNWNSVEENVVFEFRFHK